MNQQVDWNIIRKGMRTMRNSRKDRNASPEIRSRRKSEIPLCKYHHQLYHKGELNYSDIMVIRRWTVTYGKTAMAKQRLDTLDEV